MKNIDMNGTKSADPMGNIITPRNESASAQLKNDAAIKRDRDRQQRRWVAIDAALSKNPKMTHIEDRKIVAKNLWNILDKFERDGHALRDANMGEKGNSTKQLFYYTLPPFDTVSAGLEKRIDRLVKRTDKYRRLAEVAAKRAEACFYHGRCFGLVFKCAADDKVRESYPGDYPSPDTGGRVASRFCT
jgi:hypothetical protein